MVNPMGFLLTCLLLEWYTWIRIDRSERFLRRRYTMADNPKEPPKDDSRQDMPRAKRYRYVLKGDPIPLARCRVSRYTGHLRVFDPQKELKLVSQLTLKNQHGNRPLFKGPVHVDANFYFHIPKTHKKTRPGFYHVVRPDVDNLAKMLLDVGWHILFADDCVVSELFCRKLYDDEPRTEFIIYQLENNEKEKDWEF